VVYWSAQLALPLWRARPAQPPEGAQGVSALAAFFLLPAVVAYWPVWRWYF